MYYRGWAVEDNSDDGEVCKQCKYGEGGIGGHPHWMSSMCNMLCSKGSCPKISIPREQEKLREKQKQEMEELKFRVSLLENGLSKEEINNEIIRRKRHEKRMAQMDADWGGLI